VWGGAAPEGLDDGHAPAAARARAGEHLWLVVGARRIVIGMARARRQGDEFAGAGDIVDVRAAGKQAVVTDAVEAAGRTPAFAGAGSG
jgi:hypothetical protein